MPGWNGAEARAKIRQQGYRGPILAVSAHAMQGVQREARLAGFDEFVSKPIDRRNLQQTLSRFLTHERKQPLSGHDPGAASPKGASRF
jgi:CheY-like chemotaxis protein